MSYYPNATQGAPVTETPTPPDDTAPDAPTDAPAPVLHASGAEPNFTGLTFSAYRLEDQGVWSFGVTLAGAYVELVRAKLGGVDDDLREAAQPGFKEDRAVQYAKTVNVNR